MTRLGEKLVLWRDARSQVTCMADLCPHRGVALSIGQLVGECVECPFHGFQFDPTGKCILIPANGKDAPVPKAFQVKRVYPAREAHGFIYVYWGEPQKDLPPLPWFDSVDDTLPCVTVRDRWPTHYSRAIENQLDVAHLPFVHRTTIGRGNQTLVNGPRWTLAPREGGHDLLSVWYDNAVDAGQKPLAERDAPAAHRPRSSSAFPISGTTGWATRCTLSSRLRRLTTKTRKCTSGSIKALRACPSCANCSTRPATGATSSF